MRVVGTAYDGLWAFAQAKLAAIVAFCDIPPSSAQERQEFIGILHGFCWLPHIYTLALPVLFPVRRVDWFSYWTLSGLTTLYFILLAILKHRAASHRQSYKLLSTNSEGESKNTLIVCFQRIFYCGAKMTPCSSPPLASLWRVLCYLVVCRLFPKRIIYLYFAVAWLSFIIQFFMAAYLEECFMQRSDLVYNGRRFRVAFPGGYYSTLQDKEQNTLYYPNIDLYGLVASGNW
jgi:hypothetical protein